MATQPLGGRIVKSGSPADEAAEIGDWAVMVLLSSTDIGIVSISATKQGGDYYLPVCDSGPAP